MPKMRTFLMATLMCLAVASVAAADVNEILAFNNDTHEELYVALSVYDPCCEHLYDLYVRPHGSSVADFWAASLSATYSACAYGEVTGDFYGCMDGGITDFNNDIYFDYSGDPYIAGPSGRPAEVFVFDNPYRRDEVVVVARNSHHHAYVGCFIGSAAPR